MTFSYYHKTKKFDERLLRHFGPALENQYQRSEFISDSFYCVKKPHGVLFKLFLGSLNMKILSSDLVFFTLVKIFEESSLRRQVISFLVQMDYLRKRNTPANHDWKNSLRYDFILFQALETKSYEKGPFGVFFHIHSDSLNMNDTKFYFSGLVKIKN